MQESHLSSTSENSESVLQQILTELPPLSSVVRYYDDFDDTLRSITNFSEANVIAVHYGGSKNSINFDSFGKYYGRLLKHLFFFLISQEYKASSANGMIGFFSHITETDVAELLTIKPIQANSWWALARSRNYHNKVYLSIKALLKFLCAHHLNGWSSTYLDFISKLPLPYTDKYAAIRTGDVFLTIEEEAPIVHYLDQLTSILLATPGLIDDITLRNGGVLLCSYLFAMRPTQIASLAMRDVRVWEEFGENEPIVHLTFRVIKQHSKSKAISVTRRVKQDWAPIIAEQYKRSRAKRLDGSRRFFEVNSRSEMSKLIINIATKVTGTDTSSTDLRHTAAQRLVDAGASQEEVAEFMTHTNNASCLVYFKASANQAELVNNALGISEIYTRVAKIAHDKFISREELAELKDDQQIAGAPHGISISGIGGCVTGQPSCPYNPITSCYGCRKFMPVSDIDLHKRVLGDMRGVVIFFAEASHGDSHSPAYTQLQRTIASVQQVISELEAPTNA
jgi:integrase